MTPKEKAKELFDKHLKFQVYTIGFAPSEYVRKQRAKQSALITIQEVVKVLEEFGDKTMELQNMDRDFAWWDKVIEELNNA